MSDLTRQTTQTTKGGTSKTATKSSKTQKITEEIRSAPIKGLAEDISVDVPEVTEPSQEVISVVTDKRDFYPALSKATIDKAPYLEVSEEIFTSLAGTSSTPYIVYGDGSPKGHSVKVFRAGTVKSITDDEAQTADEKAGLVSSKKTRNV